MNKTDAMRIVDNSTESQLLSLSSEKLNRLYDFMFGVERRDRSKEELVHEMKGLLDMRKKQNIERGLTEGSALYDGLSLLETTDPLRIRDYFSRASHQEIRQRHSLGHLRDMFKTVYGGVPVGFVKEDELICDVRYQCGLIKGSSNYKPL